MFPTNKVSQQSHISHKRTTGNKRPASYYYHPMVIGYIGENNLLMILPFILLTLTWIFQPTLQYILYQPTKPKAVSMGMLMFDYLKQDRMKNAAPYKATKDLIDLTGTAKDGNGTPLDGQVATLYNGTSEVASAVIENGTYLMEDILLTGTTLNTDNEFWVNQNFPNPFGGSTRINYSLDKNERVRIDILDVQGKYIKTIEDAMKGPGEHSAIIDGNGLSDGIYFGAINAGDKTIVKKMVHLSGGPEPTGDGLNPKPNFKSGNEKSEYTLVISGEDFITKDTILELFGSGVITIPQLTVLEKPLITGFVYDLDTKWDANGDRLVPIGIPGMLVYQGSNSNIQTTTDNNGRFYLRLDTIPTDLDSIFIVGATPADTTYYFWKKPAFEITHDTNYIAAFNDTTGIPLFERMWDASEGQDMLEHLVFVAAVEGKLIWDSIWMNTTPRVRDEDMEDGGIKVFMNRDIAPTEWYADSAWSGLKSAEEKRFKFVEVDNINDALLVMKYDHAVPGQGVNIEVEWDEMGPYITHYEIRIRGPAGGPVLSNNSSRYVVAHEAMHIAYGTGGNHSPFIEDNFYLDALTRAVQGQPLEGTERERRTVQVYWDLERNPKFLHYFSDNPLENK